MAISLKNVDDRLRKLESQGSGFMQVVTIMSKPKYLSWSLVEFGVLPSGVNALVVCCGFGGDISKWGTVAFIPVSIVQSTEFGISTLSGREDSSTISCKIDGSSIKFRKQTEGNQSDDDLIRRIYGLKIYYIFRYNIYKLKYYVVIFQDWIKNSLKFTPLNQI